MSNRFLASFSAAIAVIGLASLPAVAQTAATQKKTTAPLAKEGARSWTPPKNVDGTPDISGIFTNSVVTPLERPRDLGAKEFFTPGEADAYAKRSLATREATGPGTYNDVHYNMAQFGLEKKQNKVAESVRTSMVIGPEGRIPPMLPEAQKRQAARAAVNRGHEFDGPENRGLAERCIIWGAEGPPMMPNGYNSNLQIVQGEGYVAIMQEMIHDVRIIPTDGRPHVDSSVRELLGDSRGHWEGNTLVVDTTNFTDRNPFHGAGENLHVVERFTRTAPDTVTYQFTADDPTTWATPWTAEIPMTKIDGPIFEYACHEGNYGMPNNLSGARADEQKAAALKK